MAGGHQGLRSSGKGEQRESTRSETDFFSPKGSAITREALHSFELALRDAGIEKCNLVQVSSILPPGCKIISKAQGMKELQAGAITYCVHESLL